MDENAWGYQVESGMKTHSWTKLLLDDSALESEYDDPDLKKALGHGMMKLPRGMTAKDVATEYLRGMYGMYKSAVAENFGEEQLAHLPVDVWLTIPATWSEKAKLLTKAAALDAGFASGVGDRMMLIPEPEAAAHLALKSSIHHVQDLVEVRNCYRLFFRCTNRMPGGSRCHGLRSRRRHSRKQAESFEAGTFEAGC